MRPVLPGPAALAGDHECPLVGVDLDFRRVDAAEVDDDGERRWPLGAVAVDLRTEASAPAGEARDLPEVGEELLHLASKPVDRVVGHGPDGSGAPSCCARRGTTVSPYSPYDPADMKGVILAGGNGTRLHPLTRITNKHLLPIYDRPMVTYAIEALVEAGITELMLVTGGTHAGEFFRLLGNGHEHGIDRLSYAYQEREGGIADALGLAERFAGGDRVVVMLADNVFERSIQPAVDNFERQERRRAHRPLRSRSPSTSATSASPSSTATA